MPIQIPKLDDRTYQQLVDETIARIPVHTPEWNNFNHSDPGITLVQMFAYMTENLLYRSNRIPEANRLKFLSLLRLPLSPAGPGYGLVTFLNDRGPVEAIALDAGLELFAGKVPFRTRTAINILPITAAAFYKRKRELDEDSVEATRAKELYPDLASATNLSYYEPIALEPPAAGKELPVVDLNMNNYDSAVDGALWLALVAPKNVSVDLARNALNEQTLSLGIYPDVKIPTWEQSMPDPLKPITLEATPTDARDLIFEIASSEKEEIYIPLPVEYAETVLERPGIVQIKLPSSEKLVRPELDLTLEGAGQRPPLVEDRDLDKRIITWIRISRPGTGSTHAARISWVGINVARVVQALRVRDERLGVGTGTPNQRFKVSNTPVLIERPLGLQSPALTEETFQLAITSADGKTDIWKRVDDIYSAKLDDLVFELDPESGQVQCGDGFRGKRFPLGASIRATYEYGGGLQGQLAIGALNKSPVLPNSIKVGNPVETWGASPGETASDGEQRISRFLRHRDRLVTQEDFREITRQTPNVDLGRVEVLPLFDPTQASSKESSGTVTVMIVPSHPLEQLAPPVPDRLMLNAVLDWLEPRRMVSSRVFVRGPQFVKVFVTMALTVLPGHVSAVVNRNVKTALRTYLSPLVGSLSSTSNPTEKGFPLSSDLVPQDLEAVVARVEGVRFVRSLQLGYIQPVEPNTPEGKIVIVTDATPLRMSGLQLPWLSNMDVREAAEAIAVTGFDGTTPGADSGQPPTMPVPVRPSKKC